VQHRFVERRSWVDRACPTSDAFVLMGHAVEILTSNPAKHRPRLAMNSRGKLSARFFGASPIFWRKLTFRCRRMELEPLPTRQCL
jgi:hypothetical protein